MDLIYHPGDFYGGECISFLPVFTITPEALGKALWPLGFGSCSAKVVQNHRYAKTPQRSSIPSKYRAPNKYFMKGTESYL
ncbi:MAG TPA: hypothetical protein VKR53_20895 [Puia sp.]|nr:hypothetical protein [Puia sp.]